MATNKKKTEKKEESKLTEAQKKIRLLNLIDTVLSQGRVNLASNDLEDEDSMLYELNAEVRKFLEDKIESILSGGTKQQAALQSGVFTGDETLVLKEFAQKMLVKAGGKPPVAPTAPKQSPVMQALTQNNNVVAQIESMGFDPKEMKPEELRQLIKELEDDDAKRETKPSS